MSSSSQNTNPTKERLRKKLNKPPTPEPLEDPNNIFEMLGKVSQVLKNDPYLVNKVNKCVAQIIGNDTLMTQLTSEIQNNLDKTHTKLDDEIEEELEKNGVYDILESKASKLDVEEFLKQSKQ